VTPKVLIDQEVSAQGDGQSCTCLGEEKSDTRDIIALYLCFLLHLMQLRQSLKWLKLHSHAHLRFY
jgi:hypothetical protein